MSGPPSHKSPPACRPHSPERAWPLSGPCGADLRGPSPPGGGCRRRRRCGLGPAGNRDEAARRDAPDPGTGRAWPPRQPLVTGLWLPDGPSFPPAVELPHEAVAVTHVLSYRPRPDLASRYEVAPSAAWASRAYEGSPGPIRRFLQTRPVAHQHRTLVNLEGTSRSSIYPASTTSLVITRPVRAGRTSVQTQRRARLGTASLIAWPRGIATAIWLSVLGRRYGGSGHRGACPTVSIGGGTTRSRDSSSRSGLRCSNHLCW